MDWIIIDEVQKVPKLLDVVHYLIEKRNLRFVLTGSSARKLKGGTSNLLAGRAFEYDLFPLTHGELGAKFSLDHALQCGTLPGLLKLKGDEKKRDFLTAYARTYLKEEVWSEQLIRKIEPFRRFLEVAAQTNGQILNYEKIALLRAVFPCRFRREHTVMAKHLSTL